MKMMNNKITVSVKRRECVEKGLDNVSHFNWCDFCGCVENIERFYYQGATLFYGHAFRCIMRRTCKCILPAVVDKQEVLTCAYCGKHDSGVITNTCMKNVGVKFEHITFCKNDICCLQYIEYIVSKRRTKSIPYVYKSCQEEE
jgi:hypothetical protein